MLRIGWSGLDTMNLYLEHNLNKYCGHSCFFLILKSFRGLLTSKWFTRISSWNACLKKYLAYRIYLLWEIFMFKQLVFIFHLDLKRVIDRVSYVFSQCNKIKLMSIHLLKAWPIFRYFICIRNICLTITAYTITYSDYFLYKMYGVPVCKACIIIR